MVYEIATLHYCLVCTEHNQAKQQYFNYVLFSFNIPTVVYQCEVNGVTAEHSRVVQIQMN